MTEASPVRRSTRTRRPAHSIYDEARVSLDSIRSREKKERVNDSDSEEERLSTSDHDDESSVEEPRRKRRKRKAASPKQRKASPKQRKVARKKPASRKTARAALSTLAKKVLQDFDNDDSIVATLLRQEHPTADIARQLVQNTECVTEMILWLFRSVGGKGVVADGVDLETCSEDELGNVLETVVEEMEETPDDRVLFPCEPPTAVGLREYRRIFEELAYEVGLAAAEGHTNRSDDDSENPQDDDEAPMSTELARDLLSRLTDLVNVGITDLRAAATTAVLSMGAGLLEQTVELQTKIATAERQLQVAQRNKQTRKKAALMQQIDVWSKQLQELEDIFESIVVAVFLKRYKDANPHIRSYSIQMLSKFTRTRPDLFLKNSFLKYMGWLLSDRSAIVRQAAVRALLAPLQELTDCSNMSPAFEKFLPRLCDCVLDVDSSVQEVTMELLVVLLRKGFLDHVEDDTQWTQINLRALAPDASPLVRKQALLFVLEQLEPFDPTTAKESEHGVVEKINALVDWIVHNLTDGEIPIEHVRYELTDLVVTSLRASPEHRSLICNWSAMMKALDSETVKTSPDMGDDDEDDDSRFNAVKQRVLLRFVICAAELEASAEDSVVHDKVDEDLVHQRHHRSKKAKTTASSHEELTLALLSALPDLLVAYKTETPVLESLTSLPKYFLPSVFNLSSRKKDFIHLVKNLSNVFLESTDSAVLQNCAMVISSLAQGEHSRTKDAQMSLKKTLRALQTRLTELLLVHKDCMEETSDDEETKDGVDNDASVVDTHQSISLCLRRLNILTKRAYPGGLLVDTNDMAAQDEAVEALFNRVAEYVAKELNSRKVVGEETADDEESILNVPEIWKSADPRIHPLVADAVGDGLTFLLFTTAWRLNIVVESVKEGNEPDNVEEHVVLRMRQHLDKLNALCFENYVKGNDADFFSKEHVEFSTSVQKHAGRTVGDLRSLFPQDWRMATSPFLSACARQGEHQSITGGLLRFLAEQESELRDCETSGDENPAAEDLLLPLARGLTNNWSTCNRREAGAGLSHYIGSGSNAQNVVGMMSRVFKKKDAVRLLEAQMACLCQAFHIWYESEPEELESDRPTDEELEAFEIAEEKHKEMFKNMEDLAARLSSSLGVGKINDKKISRALRGFLREGIRFAFSTDAGADGENPVGSRLGFLRVLSKYLVWIRKDKETKQALNDYLTMREADLRQDPEFEDILDEDKEALVVFRDVGKFGAFVGDGDDQHTAGSLDDQDRSHAQPSVASSKRRRSTPGSAGSSIWSKRSGHTSLPTVHEDEGSEEEDLTPPKRLKLSLNDTDHSVSTAGHTQDSIREGSEEGSESD